MRILDRYILKAFVGPFIFGIVAFTSIFVGTGTLYRIAQLITEYGASIGAVVKVFILALPSIVVLTFPMAVLLASLLAFGKLSGSSEIIVMRAGGQSFLRLARPVYITAFCISIFAVGFNEYVVPRTNHLYQDIVRQEIMHAAGPKSQEHIVVKDVKGDHLSTLLYAQKYDANTKELSGVTVQQFAKDDLSQVQNAQHAKWDGARWIMYDGIIYDLSAKGGVERTMRFTQEILPLGQTPREIQSAQRDPEEMTIKELREQMKIYEQNHVPTAPLAMEMYQRFAIPFASFIFALVGAPLGLQKQRSSSSIGFGISLLIIFIYYGVMTLCTTLGKGETMPPIVAAAIPDMLGVIAGLYLNWRVSQ